MPEIFDNNIRRFRAGARIVEARPEPQNNRNNRRGDGVPQILDTVGMELESAGLSRDSARGILNTLPNDYGGLFDTVHDASTEMKTYLIDGEKKQYALSAHTSVARELFSRARIASMVSGYELVSVPLSIGTAENCLRILLPKLEGSGDFFTNRCAFHVHTGMSKNLEICKKALKLGLWFDDVFYAISGFGKSFRGESNHAIYARPLVSGPYIKSKSSYYQILNWKKALESNSYYDFWACYGVDVDRDSGKYHPARYFAVNIFSIHLRGTLEIRHYNQTFNPDYAVAATKLSQMFSEIVFRANLSDLKKLEIGNPFVDNSVYYYLNKLEELYSLASKLGCKYTPDRHSQNVLGNLIEDHKPCNIPDEPVLSHLRDYAISDSVIEDGGLIKSKIKPVLSGNVDIHNIKEVSIIPKLGE